MPSIRAGIFNEKEAALHERLVHGFVRIIGDETNSDAGGIPAIAVIIWTLAEILGALIGDLAFQAMPNNRDRKLSEGVALFTRTTGDFAEARLKFLKEKESASDGGSSSRH